MLSGSQTGVPEFRREGPEETTISLLDSKRREKLTNQDTTNSEGNWGSSEWKGRQWSKASRYNEKQEQANPMNTGEETWYCRTACWTTLRSPCQLRQEFECRMRLSLKITGPKVRQFINCDSASIPGLLVTEGSSHKKQSRLRDSILKVYNDTVCISEFSLWAS